jgi:hypothetical protein
VTTLERDPVALRCFSPLMAGEILLPGANAETPTTIPTAAALAALKATQALAGRATAAATSGYEEQVRDLDVRAACDVLRLTASRMGGRDGRVSIGVDPRIAQDTARTAAEARDPESCGSPALGRR